MQKFELSVQSFSDYRAYLLAHVQSKKESDSAWTFVRWASQLKLKSTSSITKIIQGGRDPGTDITDRLVQYFRFRAQDGEYFRDLVSLHKLKKNPRLAVLLREQMSSRYKSSSSQIMESSSGDQVYQFQMQLFPLTKSKQKNKESSK
jgi:hypothetical protein